MAKNELTILMSWYTNSDSNAMACFEENRKTFYQHNPDYEIIIVVSPHKSSNYAYHYIDLTLLQWYATNKKNINSERFLLVDWSCWCNINLKEYFHNVWDADVVAPCVKYPERDIWSWFETIAQLPERARLYATGILPFCGVLVSAEAMDKISEEIILPGYKDLISELRFATIATMLGYDPVPNPVCSRPLTWKKIAPFDKLYSGLHSPRKTLSSNNLLGKIEKYLTSGTTSFPKIIHQTWKDERLDETFTKLSKTWKDLHPDWDYVLWTDEMNRAFIATYFPEFILQYDSYEHEIQRVDAVRYFILYKIGGLFVDLDFGCLKNMESILDGSQCVFGLEPAEHCEQYDKSKIICNAFMACKPNDDFFGAICTSLPFIGSSHHMINDVLSAAGPFALTDIYNAYPLKEHVKLLSSGTIYPLTTEEAGRMMKNDIDKQMQDKIDNAHAIHYFSGSWYNG